MGYELDKIMRRYGVTSPVAPTYTGAAAPNISAGENNPQYQAELSRYNEDMAKFKDYQNQYNQRMATGSMYNSPQFNAGLPGVYTGVGQFVNTPSTSTPSPASGTTSPATGTGADTAVSGVLTQPTYSNAGVSPSSSANNVYGADKLVANPNDPGHMMTNPNPNTISWVDSQGRAQQTNVSDQPIGDILDINGAKYILNTNRQYVPYSAPAAQTAQTPNNAAVAPNPAPANTAQVAADSTPATSLNTPAQVNIPNTTVDDAIYNQQASGFNIPDLSQFGGFDFSKLTGYEPRFVYKTGGAVKTNFAVGGLNDLASNYGIADVDNIDEILMNTPIDQAYEYGPRPESGPIGNWFEQVATETVPGVRVSGRARTPERNREVGGTPDSYHLTDNARDFTPPRGMSVGQLGEKLRRELGPGYDVIFNTKGHYDHVHVEPGPNMLRNSPVGKSSPTPSAPLQEPAAPPSNRLNELQTLLETYTPDQDVYGPELKAARERVKGETDAFSDMLASALESPEDAKISKAEMYFRLASAFGSPSKTGQFTENLSMAGKEMGDYAKSRRESSQNKLALRLKAQELKMGAAKEELGTLRSLAGEEMKDRRTMAQQLIKEYIESGKPQSAAGKQALDEGLTPGTPQFQARVSQISQLNIERQAAVIQASLGNLSLNQQREQRAQQQSQKLTGPELTMKRDTEDALASIDNALSLLSQAYTMNPNSFDASLVDTARRRALEFAGSKDPKLINTRTLENLLKSEMITSAAQKMKGVLSDSDIRLLESVQGMDAKSVEERANILRSAYAVLKRGRTRMQTRLQDLSSGAYREVSGE